MNLLEKINKVLEIVVGSLIGIITLLVLLQVFFRYVLETPLTGSEELARYAVIWLVILGFAVLVRTNGNIAVTFFAEKFSAGIQKAIRIGVYGLNIIFFIILIVYGFDLSLKAMIQVTPATGFRMGYVDLVVPLAGLLSLLFTIEHLINEFKSNSKELEKGGN